MANVSRRHERGEDESLTRELEEEDKPGYISFLGMRPGQFNRVSLSEPGWSIRVLRFLSPLTRHFSLHLHMRTHSLNCVRFPSVLKFDSKVLNMSKNCAISYATLRLQCDKSVGCLFAAVVVDIPV